MPMPPPSQERGRVDLSEIKSQIVELLGPDAAHGYFKNLTCFLSQRISRNEFQRFCMATFGRKNIALHNHLIRSIIKNAYHPKRPLPNAASKCAGKMVSQENNVCPSATEPQARVLSNGNILPTSPRKGLSCVNDQKTKDFPSTTPRSKRKTDVAVHQSSRSGDGVIVVENGSSRSCDLKQPIQPHQDGNAEQPKKRIRADDISPNSSAFVNGMSSIEEVTAEERNYATHHTGMDYTRSPIRAPHGMPFYSTSVCGSGRSLSLSSANYCGSNDKGELHHTEELRKCMERIAERQGLSGVSIDCANLLNNALDAYLKGLIAPCVGLVRARRGCDPKSPTVCKQLPNGKVINGVWPGNQTLMHGSNGPLETIDKLKKCSVSLNDFKIAMQSDPKQLGENWPLHLEKITTYSFEEED